MATLRPRQYGDVSSQCFTHPSAFPLGSSCSTQLVCKTILNLEMASFWPLTQFGSWMYNWTWWPWGCQILSVVHIKRPLSRVNVCTDPHHQNDLQGRGWTDSLRWSSTGFVDPWALIKRRPQRSRHPSSSSSVPFTTNKICHRQHNQQQYL